MHQNLSIWDFVLMENSTAIKKSDVQDFLFEKLIIYNRPTDLQYRQYRPTIS